VALTLLLESNHRKHYTIYYYGVYCSWRVNNTNILYTLLYCTVEYLVSTYPRAVPRVRELCDVSQLRAPLIDAQQAVEVVHTGALSTHS
jgi:hypothetical protein